jgi:hypothetical protein
MIDNLAIKALRTKEKLIMAIAWRLPKTLVMWCFIRVMANATAGQYSNVEVGSLSGMDALNVWTQPDRARSRLSQ